MVWNVPKVISYNSKYKAKDCKKSVMIPYYSRYAENNQMALFGGYEEDSKVEIAFINYLDNAKKIEWRFKNGQGEVNYFVVPYVDKYGKRLAFYVDFIAQMKNGDDVWLLHQKRPNS